MKKFISISLVLIIMLCAAACSAEKDSNASNAPESPLTLLNEIWGQYGDDEKFPVAGGDFSEENANMEGPGKYGIEDAEAIDAALGFPAASIDMIDDAASLTNMMNANNFTCAVYHVKDSADVSAVASAVKDNIDARQWMCGFPEKLTITTYDSYVIVVFGADEFTSVFNAKLTQTYADAQTVVDEPIA